MSTAVSHLLARIQADPRLAWLIGPGSESYELLTAEAAAAANTDLSAFREQFERALSYEPWPRLELRAEPPALRALPALGAYWSGEGGEFAGLFRGSQGETRVLILAQPMPAEQMHWKRGIEWSKSLDIDGHRDFLMPDRCEGQLLWVNLKDHFAHEAHWLREERSASHAWTQDFYYGLQFNNAKSWEGRVCACRSFVLQSFSPSAPSATEAAA